MLPWKALLFAHGVWATCAPPAVTIKSGVIHGVATDLPDAASTVHKYLGVPYAARPQRFSLPREAEPWTTPLNATEFGPACLQNFGINAVGPRPELLDALFNNPKPPESEDCLTLNVFAPAARPPRGGYPVVVFIPGGGWQIGSGRADLSSFAAYDDVVAVTINYRTNLFGFPAAPEIPATERNLGLHDQRFALAWVQENIRAFGGSPHKVTIWGESAGAMSVELHLKAYADGEPPFRAAILSSGQMTFGYLAFTAPGDAAWAALALLVGCAEEGRLECMRGTPSETLLRAMRDNQIGFAPQIDNVTVPSRPADVWRNGSVARVPVLTGTVAEEGRVLVNDQINLTLFKDAFFSAALLPTEVTDLIFSVYRRDPKLATDFDVAAAIYTDYFWLCPQLLLANASAANGMPTWLYYFNTSTASLLPQEYAWLGKFHGSEIGLLFSNSSAPLTAQSYAVYASFRRAISQFIKNPPAGPGWPAVGSRFAPLDVAVIGDVLDVAAGGATPFDSAVIHDRCNLYKDIYPILELVIG